MKLIEINNNFYSLLWCWDTFFSSNIFLSKYLQRKSGFSITVKRFYVLVIWYCYLEVPELIVGDMYCYILKGLQ